jgi:hypothetical protein
MRLTNKSGGAVALGDVVICDSTTASSFTTTTTGALTTDSIGVALETIADNATGRVCTGGYVEQVNLDGAASLGDTIGTDTVAKQATPHAAIAVGDFGQVLATGTSPAAWLWGGIGLPSAGSGDTFTQAQYVVMTADADLTAERVLTAGVGLTLTDGGAGNAATLAFGDIGARVYNDTAITITTATATALTFNQERYDTDTIHSTVADTSRLTCKTAGKYFINGQISFDGSVTGLRDVRLDLNGASQIVFVRSDTLTGNTYLHQVSTVWSLAVNDYVELVVYQTKGTDLDATVVAGHSPEFMMQLIAEV